jgi:uncharacterized cupredoxin-like copper-binding protein
MRTRTIGIVIVIVAVVLALAAASAIAINATRVHHRRFDTKSGTNCAAPNLPGSLVHVTLTNAGGFMMGNGGGPMMGGTFGGMMRLGATPDSVPAGHVSFVATNSGSTNHELVILPLPANQAAGVRPVQPDETVDETGRLGEASKSCGAGSGEGIAPGTASWVTLTLARGRYELVCNLPGHYAAGMYSQLTVR